MTDRFVAPGAEELALRRNKIRELMQARGYDAMLVSSNVNMFYTCGRVINGFLYLAADGTDILFARRPNNLEGDVTYIRKPEQIPALLAERGISQPSRVLLEGGSLAYAEFGRLSAVFAGAECADGTPLIREARAVKTPWELDAMRLTGKINSEIYRLVPSLYRKGMTDLEFSIEIERQRRLRGDIGAFRIYGQSMEVFMGSLLCGRNAAAPSPYDFALGGEGLGGALPVGLNNSVMLDGTSVMVDMAGNFFGYMGDMTRTFSVGRLPEKAYDAHKVCLEIQSVVTSMARPGVVCEDLYNAALEVVRRYGLEEHFMGFNQHAGFVGHGVGLEINESPVIAPRIRTELREGMTFALEPKMVLPETGAVGIENLWIVTPSGVENTGDCPEEIIPLC